MNVKIMLETFKRGKYLIGKYDKQKVARTFVSGKVTCKTEAQNWRISHQDKTVIMKQTERGGKRRQGKGKDKWRQLNNITNQVGHMCIIY